MMNTDTAEEFLRQWRFYLVLAESAGLFWIFAELAILFGVRMGRSRIELRPIPRRIVLSRGEHIRARVQLALFLAGAAVLLGRHYLGPLALPVVTGNGSVPGHVAAQFIHCIHVHQVLWAGFVTAWVALECAIVWHGFQGYRQLCLLLPPQAAGQGASGSGRWMGAIALVIVLGATGARAAAVDPLHDALRATAAADGVYWNALFLYLRVAGVVWIAVEWVAAMVLWRTWRLLRMPRPEAGHD